MKLEIADEWYAALTGGEYQQTRSALHVRGKGFCCLGVLCDLHAKATGNDWDDDRKDGASLYMESRNYLPAEVKEWAGMRYCDGTMTNFTALSDMNDNGKTFPEIAEIIRANSATL